MELKINEIQAIAPVTFNFEELKKELIEKSEKYKTAVYTEEEITIAKKDRSNLHKLVKAVNDEKIRVKNEVMKPYLPFETQCKELMEIVKAAADNIDAQIKNYEDQKRARKLQEIQNYFVEHVGIYEGLIDFELIFNERWLNVTYDISTIFREIDHVIAKAKGDLMTINNLVKNEETNKQAIEIYFKNINNPNCLSLALNEAKHVEARKAQIEEIKKSQEKKTEEQKQTIIQNTKLEASEKLYPLTFKVYLTSNNMYKLKDFFVTNKIKYEQIMEKKQDG